MSLRRAGSFFRTSLARGFVEEDAGGYGGVEAFDGAGGGDGDARGAAGSERCRDAGAFRADDEGGGLAERVFMERRGLVRHGGYGLDARGGEAGEAFVFGDVNEGQAEDAAGGGAHGFGVPGADGAVEGDDSGGTEGFGGAEDGAEVAGVLEAGQDDEERIGNEDRLPGPGGRLGEGGDGLRSFRGDSGGEDVGGEDEAFERGGKVELAEEGFAALGYEDGGETQAALDGFLDEVQAFEADGVAAATRRAKQGCAQLFYARVLPALYGAEGHCVPVPCGRKSL